MITQTHTHTHTHLRGKIAGQITKNRINEVEGAPVEMIKIAAEKCKEIEN